MSTSHILLTNDDGFGAPGLLALREALLALGKVTVIAPSRNYSASGHRKTMHKPLRIDPVPLPDGETAYVCSGAPSDCVALALLGFVKEKLDLVIAGINPYPNLGQDVTYSGTVTAALEAVLGGIPGIAVSTDASAPGSYETAAEVARTVASAALEKGLPPLTVLNVNVPGRPISELKGVRITRRGMRVYRDALVERQDPRGKPYYWIGGEIPTGIEDEGTDFWALANGHVSITPLHLDMTSHGVMPELEKWGLEVERDRQRIGNV